MSPPRRCWERNEKVAVWWVIRCPILVAVAVGDIAAGWSGGWQCPHLTLGVSPQVSPVSPPLPR